MERFSFMKDKALEYLSHLELKPGVSIDEIKTAYRDLCHVWHPDKHHHSDRLRDKATKKLQQINQAYEWLSQNIEILDTLKEVIECQNCSKKLRVPILRGIIKVTCPDCKHQFTCDTNAIGSNKKDTKGTASSGAAENFGKETWAERQIRRETQRKKILSNIESNQRRLSNAIEGLERFEEKRDDLKNKILSAWDDQWKDGAMQRLEKLEEKISNTVENINKLRGWIESDESKLRYYSTINTDNSDDDDEDGF